MSELELPHLITDSATVEQLAGELLRAGSFAFDLEFLSANRYIPELALVQVGWGDRESPRVAAVDPLSAEIAPLLALVARADITKLLHSAQGDLALLGARYGVEAKSVVDTQLAALLAGLGESVGYARLIAELLGREIDKGLQFTNWLERPLTPEKLSYALDDVRYLPLAWARLEQQLASLGRLEWLGEESARLAASAARRLPPAEIYQKLGGWQRLSPPQLGAFAALAQWREERALETNKPPSWLLKDPTLLTLARRLPRKLEEIAALDGPDRPQLERQAERLLALVERGRARPIAPPPPLPASLAELKKQLQERVAQEAKTLALPASLLAPKGELETLLTWKAKAAETTPEPPLALLTGWRRKALGQALLEELEGMFPQRGLFGG